MRWPTPTIHADTAAVPKRKNNIDSRGEGLAGYKSLAIEKYCELKR